MTIDEMIQFVNEYYPVPIQKHWKPSEYDMKYRYNTPRKLKKLEKDREKNDVKLYSEYEAEVKCRNEVIHTINDINLLPERLKDLFYLTLKNQVLNDIKTREEFSKYSIIFRNKYDIKDPDKKYGGYTFYQYASELVRNYKEQWDEQEKKFIRKFDERLINRYKTDIHNFDKVDMNAFYIDASKYFQMQKSSEETMFPPENLVYGCKKMKDIIKSIENTIGGNPEYCEYDTHWGIGNEFNGTVGRGEKRASFKSFLAGGWNIQRLHIRFRITLLKG